MYLSGLFKLTEVQNHNTDQDPNAWSRSTEVVHGLGGGAASCASLGSTRGLSSDTSFVHTLPAPVFLTNRKKADVTRAVDSKS